MVHGDEFWGTGRCIEVAEDHYLHPRPVISEVMVPGACDQSEGCRATSVFPLFDCSFHAELVALGPARDSTLSSFTARLVCHPGQEPLVRLVLVVNLKRHEELALQRSCAEGDALPESRQTHSHCLQITGKVEARMISDSDTHHEPKAGLEIRAALGETFVSRCDAVHGSNLPTFHQENLVSMKVLGLRLEVLGLVPGSEEHLGRSERHLSPQLGAAGQKPSEIMFRI